MKMLLNGCKITENLKRVNTGISIGQSPEVLNTELDTVPGEQSGGRVSSQHYWEVWTVCRGGVWRVRSGFNLSASGGCSAGL